jgi:hypothetical protein
VQLSCGADPELADSTAAGGTSQPQPSILLGAAETPGSTNGSEPAALSPTQPGTPEEQNAESSATQPSDAAPVADALEPTTETPAAPPVLDEPRLDAASTTAGSSATNPPPAPRRCEQALGDAPPDATRHFAIGLQVHTPRSQQSQRQLCAVLDEMNQIWWSQAGICFDIEVVEHDEAASDRLDLWFESDSPFPNGVEANGVYVNPHEIYSLDTPILAAVADSVVHPAARTAAHELGHALGLAHQNCGFACLGLLMTSGTMGYRLVTSEPANVDEIATARDIALRSTAGPAVTELAAGAQCPGAALPPI